VTTPAAFLQIAGGILVSQHPGQVAQALPGLGAISIEDDETGSAFLVKRICAQRDLTPQMGKQVAYVQRFVDAVNTILGSPPRTKTPLLVGP
jgi:hypothetical protein